MILLTQGHNGVSVGSKEVLTRLITDCKVKSGKQSISLLAEVEVVIHIT